LVSGRVATRVGVTLSALTAINFVVFVAAGESSGLGSGISALLALMCYTIVGTLVVGRYPGNALAWIFCIAPFAISTSGAATALFEHGGADLPARTLVGLVGDTGWIIGIGLPACFLGLLIPDGRLPSPRWRPLAWLAAVTLTAAVVGTVFGESQVDDRIANPVQVSGAEYLFPVAAVAILVLLVAGVAASVLRYRRGTPIERQQLKWIVAAFVAMIVVGVATANVSFVPEPLWFGSWCLLPIAFAIAIFRYRLYEIDVIIRKTLVYATLVVSLALLYLSGVLLIGRGLQAVTGQSSALAVTVSTLAVAAAFQPLRRRIQRGVNHRFYRQKYDASQTLDTFSSRLRSEIDLDALHTELLKTVTATVAPTQVSLWLHPNSDEAPKTAVPPGRP
jgi:hypothetical protein